MTELKPCPFCGGKSEVVELDSVYLHGFVARCANEDCIIVAETDMYPTEAEAIEAWNTRAERTCENLAKPEDADDLPFHCSECGARSSYGDGTFHIGESFTLNGNLMLADAWNAWRHCPNCGAKVR